MSTLRAQRIRELFDQAIELDPAARAAALHAASGGDETLMREVMELIAAVEGKRTPLDVNPAVWFHEVSLDSVGHSAGTEASSAGNAEEGVELTGALIGGFRLVRLLGRGGMSVVYEAEQLELGRRVALKVLQTWTARREVRRRFIEEAATLGQLRHQNIAQVYSAGAQEFTLSSGSAEVDERVLGEARSLPWIAIELVPEAKTIVDACREATEAEVLEMFAMVADAVHHGHQQGFIHRDLKPANILVDARGTPKVIDFGIARAMGASASAALTHAGELLGSPRYMSPEQCDPRVGPVDTRSDVYSLGVVLFEALTGQSPHDAPDDSIAAVARAICEREPRDPRTLNPALSRDAALVVLKAIERAPDVRYQSAAELAADLRRVVAREPIAARRPSTAYSMLMLMRRRPVMTALVAAALVGLVAGMVGITLGLSRERAARKQADRTAWLANISGADAAIRLGDGGMAMRRLLAVPPERRGWEWGYLRRRADASTEDWDVPGAPYLASISPKGAWVLAGWVDEGITRIYAAGTHEQRGEWRLGQLTGAPEWDTGETLLALPMLDSVQVVDVESGAVRARVSMTGGGLPLACAFSPDNRLLAIGRAKPSGVEVYDLASGMRVFNAPSEGWVYRPAFTPDGHTLLWCAEFALRRVDCAMWQEQAAVPVQRSTMVEPSPVVIAPDGHTAAVGCGTFVQLVDLPSGTVRAELRDHGQRVHSVRFDSLGDRLITTSIDRTVRVWDARTGRQIAVMVGHETPTMSAAFVQLRDAGPDSLISVDAAARVRRWDADSVTPVKHAELALGTEYVRQVCIDDDDARVRAAARVAITELDLRTPGAVSREKGCNAVHVCLVPGTDSVIRNAHDSVFTLESLTTGAVQWTINVEPAVAIVVNPTGSVFAVQQLHDRVAVFRVADGARIGVIESVGSSDHLVTFSPDGTRLLIPSYNGRVRLFNAQSCTLIAELAGPGTGGQGTGFSPDGALLAYCHHQDGVTVLDVRTLRPVCRIDGVGGVVWSLAFSPDNRRLAVGAQDRVTHIYELPSGDELLQLRDHTGSVMSLTWSHDGRFLGSGGYDKRVFVYDGHYRERRP